MTASQPTPPTTTMEYTTLLDTLRTQQSTFPLTIVTLASPIIASTTHPSKTRNSDGSADLDNADNAATPVSLQDDLAHYKDLFSKLRFSYLEQVTKEKFLRSIVGDPPLVVSHADNAKLEDELARQKAELKSMKGQVDGLVEEVGEMARGLAGRWEGVGLQMTQLEVLPGEVESMRREVERMQGQMRERMGGEEASLDPRMNLGLEETEGLVREQQARAREVERQIAQLQRQVPGKVRECEVVERELEKLEKVRNEKTQMAREARRIKEEGGRDLVEETGRWYRSKEIVLKGLLDVQVEG